MEKSTAEVADLLGVKYWNLTDMIRARRIPQPRKDSTACYRWSAENIAEAREALANSRRRRETELVGA